MPGTRSPPPSSAPSSAYAAGRTRLAILSWPMPSATALFTTPTASSWRVRNPCANARALWKTPKAPSAHRALPGPGVYRFGFSRKAGALTRERKATQRAAFPPNLAAALMSLPSVALPSAASKSTFRVTPCTPLVNIQRCGLAAQSRRWRCSIPPESVLNLAGFGALVWRYIHLFFCVERGTVSGSSWGRQVPT